MAVTMDIVTNVRMDSESYLTGSRALSSDGGQKVSDTVNANAVANVVAIAPFQFAKLVGIYLHSDVNIELTFIDGASNVVVTLVEDEPQVWDSSSWLDNPFTANVSSVTANNATASNALLTARILTSA